MSQQETNPSNQFGAEERAVDRESLRIATNPEHHRRLIDFYMSCVKAPAIYPVEGVAVHRFVDERFSGIGRNGTMVHIRHVERSAGAPHEAPHTAVMVSWLGSEETEIITDIHSESVHDYSGSTTQRLYLCTSQPERERKILLTQDACLEDIKSELENYAMYGSAPELVYAHSQWSFKRGDGTVEPLSDIHRVVEEVRYIVSRFGSLALTSNALQDSTQLAMVEGAGHMGEKVVA